LGFSIFLFARWQGQRFVELAWLTFLFNVGLAHCFVGVELSEFPVGPSWFFCLSGSGGSALLSCG
jgi:hypothetical protein